MRPDLRDTNRLLKNIQALDFGHQCRFVSDLTTGVACCADKKDAKRSCVVAGQKNVPAIFRHK